VTRLKNARENTKFSFDLEDLTPVIYIAETLSLDKLYEFIDKEKKRGSSNINIYMVVLYKKYSVPVSAFILTIIAVSVSYKKRRRYGNEPYYWYCYCFWLRVFDKIFGTLAEKSTFHHCWQYGSNIIFGILAIFYFAMQNDKLKVTSIFI
jgi:lipopolysaccharide export system permease protein